MSYESSFKLKAQHGWNNMTTEEREDVKKKAKHDWDNMPDLFKTRSNFESFKKIELQEAGLRKFKTLKLDPRYDYEKRGKNEKKCR